MIRRLPILLALALLVAAGCRGRQGPPITRLELREKHRVHRVQPGESAWAIAKRYEVTLDELVALNELADASKIYPGDELLIPGPKAEAERRAPSPPPPPKAPPTPAAAELSGPPRPSERRCEDVKVWLQPPEEISDKGFSWPVDGVVIMKYGKKDGLPYEGIAIAAPTGTAVRAAADGKVAFAGEQGGFGNLVLVQHEAGRTSVYAHQHVNCVEAGQKVARGEVVGLVGQTGGTQSPYLYFEVRDGKETINPRVVLPP